MYSKITNAANNAWQELAVEKTMDQAGYVYIYTATESNTNVDIYFDDFDIQVEQTHIVAGNDYYPFGLPIVERSYKKQDYRYDYQGAYSEKDDETGYNAFQLRQYACPDAKQFGNARIGRWISPDPYGQYASAYVGMGNNPISGVDPDGGMTQAAFNKGMLWAGIGGVGAGLAAKALGADNDEAFLIGIAGAAAGFGASFIDFSGNTVKPGNKRFPTTKKESYTKFKNKGSSLKPRGYPPPKKIDPFTPDIGDPFSGGPKEVRDVPDRREIPKDIIREPDRKYDHVFDRDPMAGFVSNGLPEDLFWRYVSNYTDHAVDQALSAQKRGYDYIEVTLNVGGLDLDPVEVLQRVHRQFGHLPYMFESNEWYKIKNSGSQRLLFRFYKY